MSLEVEQKFRVSDRPGLERQLAALGARPESKIDQVDRYFAHPARDFARTDEALRIRQVGEDNYITYKGPKLDRTTKTRHEIEIELSSGTQTAQDTTDLLAALGFSPVAEVAKQRVQSRLNWQGREITVALDHLPELGDFVELEIMAEPTELDAAREAVIGLAQHLGLAGAERRSYLELLLEARQKSG